MALNVNSSRDGKPHIGRGEPPFGVAGGEVRVSGLHLRPAELRQPTVRFGDALAPVVISADQFLIARVPEEGSGPLTIATGELQSNAVDFGVAVPVAENLHPVASPAV